MANEANNENFKNKLTKELKEKIQKSVENSFEKNIGGRGKIENAGIKKLEERIIGDYKDSAREGRNRYENAMGGFAGNVAGRVENPRIRDFEKRVVDTKNKYAEKGNAAQNRLKDSKRRIQDPAARQTEVRKIKESVRRNRENIKKDIKEKGKKIKEKTKENLRKRRIALKSKLKERAKKKLTMNAKKGKSGCITTLFFIALFLALLNDSLDIIATVAAWIIGLIAVGVGITISVPAVEIILDVIDIITSFLLIAFSLYVGGVTKGGTMRKIKPLLRCVGGTAIEMIPIVNLFFTWVVVVLMNWRDARKRASEAEKSEAEINQLKS